MFTFTSDQLQWINPPEEYEISENKIFLTTMPGTDLWQRTYYGFRRANAHMLVMPTGEQRFSFYVKAAYDGCVLYDQCGMVIFQDEENWFKCALEYMNEQYQDLGSVVTNHGYSDFGTTAIEPSVKEVYFRLSRREGDYRLERSFDAKLYRPMRVFHLAKGGGEVRIGVFACSPSNSSCHAEFTGMKVTDCVWE